MFTLAGGYYIDTAGGGIMGDIIMGNITSQDTLIPLNPDDIPGTYICNTVSTCKNKYTLILKNDKTIELLRTLATKTAPNNNEQVGTDTDPADSVPDSDTEKGDWNLDVQNILVINITGKGDKEYDVAQKIVVKNVRSKTLSKISYTKANYKDMSNPIFIKQE